MSKVVVFGIGQIAEVVHFYLTNDSEHEVVAFTVNREYMEKQEFKGLPVVPFEQLEEFYSPKDYKLIIPISYKGMNKMRADRYYDAKRRGYSFISYISSKATYYGTPVGENSIIFENNVIQPFTSIGDNTILWSGNHIGHHARIGNHCFIASHVVVSGAAQIKDYCFLGVNSTIRDSAIVEKGTLVGAGAVILKNTDEQDVYTDRGTLIIAKKSNEIKNI